MVPPSGYFRSGSSLSSSNIPDVKVSAVPDISSLRRIVRAKWSSMPDTISVKHSLPTTEGAPFVSAASMPPTESVQLCESQSESSDSRSVSSDSLFESGDVREPMYWKYSKERTY